MTIKDYQRLEIIENTEKARNKFGWNHGAEELKLTQVHIDALLAGKCIAFDDGEYVLYLMYEAGGRDECT